MSAIDDTASLQACFNEGWYLPDPEVTVNRTSNIRSIRTLIYLESPYGYARPLSREIVSVISQSFKTNLESVRHMPVAREIVDIWLYTCLSYAHGSNTIMVPPIMTFKGPRKEGWFELAIFTAPESEYDEARTLEGVTEATA